MHEIKNYINGEFIKGSGIKKDIINPSNGEVIGNYFESTKEDLSSGIEKIKVAQKEWAKLTLRKRSEVMYKYRQLLIEQSKELSELNALENGKLPFEAMGGINKAIEVVEYACSMPNSIKTRISEVSTGIFAYEDKRPVGIVSSIAPFNFPSMIPHWTVPVSLMAGNAVILKPSEITPISAFQMASMLKEAGLPDGIFNIINGGKDIVEEICDNQEIKAITFVGSSKVAKIVYERASKNGKKVLALGEAKNHIITTPETDPTFVAKNIIASAFGMSGQRCMAASVILPVGKFHFKDELISILSQQVMGKNYGSIIIQNNLDKIIDYIEYAEKSGAEILVDGRKQKPLNKTGFWLAPTVIDWGKDRKKMKPNEIFGPVLEIIHVDSVEEAIEVQNESPYGNGASIFTQNGRYAQEAAKGLGAGMIGINIGVPVPREPFSFGGIKNSRLGNGNITGDSLYEFVTESIKVTMKWNVEGERKDWMS